MPDKNIILSFKSAVPFWSSVLFAIALWASFIIQGWAILLVPVFTLLILPIIDQYVGLRVENLDTNLKESQLFWYRLITLIWAPIQFLTLFGILTLTMYTEMALAEKIGLFCAMGVLTGTIGINYAHELMHKTGKIERWLADALLAMVLYSHFRSEHLLVHHIHVGTPRDPVTAKYNENFYKFFIRVLIQCPISSFKSESIKLGRKGLPPSDFSNPFYIYFILQIFMIALSFLIGGFLGLFLFFLQAFVAILLLELVNYIEHYGLSRKILKNGKYEFVQPHHSWNSTYKVSNWVLINLQRHSDHHFKPARSFPLLQNLGATKAPQLPHSYPAMGILALFPSAWMSIMNPRVSRWREMFYPEITDWKQQV